MPSRRRFVGAAATGVALVAGCASSDSDDDGDTNPSTGARQGETDGTPSVAWDEVAEFRKWLTDERLRETSNLRFEYLDDAERVVEFAAAGSAIDALELTVETVDARLSQSGVEILLGEYDPDAIVADLENWTGSGEDDAGHEVTGEISVDDHDGYTVLDDEIAVGPDAILYATLGGRLAAPIEARHGDRDRLETVDPEFTRLFDELPDGDEVIGQYDSPAGGDVDVDAVSVWGAVRESEASGEMTWVFVLEEEADLTDDVLAELERVGGDALESSADGRIATVTAELPF